MLYRKGTPLIQADAGGSPVISSPPTPKMLKGELTFDYLVVGAGTAGCALVDRLLARTEGTVLLMEAGGLNDDPLIHDFTKAMQLRGSKYDWNDSSQPQTCMSSEQVGYNAGRVVGGSSSINGMVWVWGNPKDYDRWVDSGAVGWGAQATSEVFRRQESYGPRRTTGPVVVTDALSRNGVSDSFVQAVTTRMGIPFNPDYNSGTQTGVFYTQLNVQPKPAPMYGLRQDAFSAFISPNRGNPRLVFANGCRVSRILFDSSRRAVGVEYDYQGRIFPVTINREVILSAGTLRSPQLLMLSGIGDPSALRSVGIPVGTDLPGVGKNLQDQLITFVVRKLAQIDPNHFSAMDNGMFFGSTPDGRPRFQVQTFYMKNNPGLPPNSFGIGTIVLDPLSRGAVTLKSSSYLDPPLIQPQLLCDQRDVPVTLEALKLAREIGSVFAAGGPWAGPELMPGPDVVTDPQLIAYIRQTAIPDFHFVGTCKMGNPSDGTTVVDPRLRVRGVTGLRVADASVMPYVTSGNTNAPSMMIGGMAGDLVAAST